jgi:hypothetical protein
MYSWENGWIWMDLDGFGWIWGLSLQVNNMGTSLWELNGDLPGMRFASINASKNPYLVAKIPLTITSWWLTYPSEEYESNWIIIPAIGENNIHVPGTTNQISIEKTTAVISGNPPNLSHEHHQGELSPTYDSDDPPSR